MNDFFPLLILCFSLLEGATGCRARSPQSHAKHLFGQTTRDSKQVTLCHWNEKESSNVTADRYLAKLVAKITEKNPKTFQDQFLPENICLYTIKDSTINAFAWLGTNKIVVNTGLILAAQNDAEIAFTLSHELAHLTMQSAHMDEVPPAVFLHPDWTAVRDEFERETQRVQTRSRPLRDASHSHFKNRKKICLDWSATLPEALRKDIKLLENERFQLMSEAETASFPDYQKVLEMEVPTLTGGDNIRDTCTSCAIVPRKNSVTSIEPFNTHYNAVFAALKTASPTLLLQWQTDLEQERVLKKEIKIAEESLKPFQLKFDEFITRVAGAGANFNWREQEADEVGYEFALRTELKPEYASWIQRNAMKEPEYQDCMNTHVAKRNPPTRGNGSHPEYCWRIYDFLVLEADYHKQDYAPLLENAKIVTFFDGELDAVKKSLTEPPVAAKAAPTP